MIDVTQIQTPDDLVAMLDMVKVIAGEEQYNMLKEAINDAKTCLDAGDMDGALKVADRFGPEAQDYCRLMIETYGEAAAREKAKTLIEDMPERKPSNDYPKGFIPVDYRNAAEDTK